MQEENNQGSGILQEQQTDQSPRSTKAEYVGEFLKIFITAAAIILPIRLFLVQPFYVKGASMEPNFYENEYLIIDKITPIFRQYQRGEVIVFRYPKSDNRFLIKRVIGLPGESIDIRNQQIRITNKQYPNGLILDEETYNPRELRDVPVSFTLTNNEFFVLGDNRPVSLDSESFGPITKDQIVGRVFFRGLPISRVTLIKSPAYSNEIPANK